MADLIREAPLGQLIRWVTGNKYLKYPEEEADFQCPKCYRDPDTVGSLSSVEEEKTDLQPSDSAGRKEVGNYDNKEPDLSPVHMDADTHQPFENLEAQKTNVTVRSGIDHEQDFEKIHTHKTNITMRSGMGARPALTRTRTREMTRAYTQERFDIEREERSLREASMPIVAQKNEDGDILVDWYTTNDPANPQNWSSKKKAFVGLQIL
jgi:MFS transporter, DHA1 family, multidrug resistance protein